jgi:hypothetical protein
MLPKDLKDQMDIGVSTDFIANRYFLAAFKNLLDHIYAYIVHASIKVVSSVGRLKSLTW